MKPRQPLSSWITPKEELSFNDTFSSCADNKNSYFGNNPFYEHGVGFGVSDPFQHYERFEKERQLSQMDIVIPIIKERTQHEISKNTNRRKQKIQTISSRYNLHRNLKVKELTITNQ